MFLRKEGIKYDPDLVVLSFVLNDVTEKFGLIRFGGSRLGFQLEHSILTLTDWLSYKSSIV